MTKSKAEQPPEPPIVLRENSIVNGEFFRAGTPLPFTRVEDLPESLKPLLADGSEEFYHPSERLIYDNPQPGPDPGVVYQPLSGGQWVRRQARQAASISQEQIYAEEQVIADQRISPELEEELQSQHDLRIGRAKAQLEASQRLTDSIYESVTAVSEPIQRFVRRGSVYVRIEKATLKAGENVFIKHPSGNHEIIGTTDADGVPPELPILT